MFDSGSFSTNSFSTASFEFGEIVIQPEQGPTAFDYRVRETQTRLNNAIADEQDILDLTAMSLLTNWHH